MSKRKITAGGYEESSDADMGETPERASKRPPSVPYAPPRLITSSKSGVGAFQLPGSAGSTRASLPPSRHVSLSSNSSRRPTPAAENVGNVGHTLKSPTVGELDPLTGPDPVRRSSVVGHSSCIPKLAGPSDAPKPNLDSHKAGSGRSTLALERQINELTDNFEEYKCASEARQKSNEGTLTRILEAVHRLDSANSGSLTSRAPTPFLSTSLTSADSKPLFSNPAPTPELIKLVSKVVSEARSCVGKKKGGADDNSCKEHARNTFYRMLGITIASEIRPYFEDDYGEPDTLPAQFVDPDTKYCRPYPHWKLSLAKQVAWIPTYIVRFRSTIPNDQSELSTMLRNLTDEQVLILLNDGPFKSACAAWRNAKKTDSEIEAMRTSARRYQRTDRKAALRATYIRTIPSLQGPEWEYLAQPGYVSQDESDGEGGFITKRADHRARWETNLYAAMHVAEREKAKAKPGLCPRLPPSRVELVRRAIPHLERGTGTGKATIRIAVCGISKSWRESNPEEFQKGVPFLNMKASTKPDIRSFLTMHPMPELDGGESVKEEPKTDHEASDLELWAFGTQVDGQLGEGDRYGMDCELGVSDNVAEGHVNKDTSPNLEARTELQEQGVTDVVIDPALLPAAAFNSNDRLEAEATPSSENQGTPGPPRPALDSHMPPPPLLVRDPVSISEQTPIDATPVKGRGRRGKKATSIEGSANTDEVPEAPAPKRRGRPAGSKNKSKK